MTRLLLLALTVLAVYCSSSLAQQYQIRTAPNIVDSVVVNTKTQKIHITGAGQSFITNLLTPLRLRRYGVIKDMKTRQCLMTVLDDDYEERRMNHQKQKFVALSRTKSGGMYTRKKCYGIQERLLSRYQQTTVVPVYKADCASIRLAFNRWHGYGSSEEYLWTRSEEAPKEGDLQERAVAQNCDGLCEYKTCSRSIVIGLGKRCCGWKHAGWGCVKWCDYRYHYRPCYTKYRKTRICRQG